MGLDLQEMRPTHREATTMKEQQMEKTTVVTCTSQETATKSEQLGHVVSHGSTNTPPAYLN